MFELRGVGSRRIELSENLPKKLESPNVHPAALPLAYFPGADSNRKDQAEPQYNLLRM